MLDVESISSAIPLSLKSSQEKKFCAELFAYWVYLYSLFQKKTFYNLDLHTLFQRVSFGMTTINSIQFTSPSCYKQKHRLVYKSSECNLYFHQSRKWQMNSQVGQRSHHITTNQRTLFHQLQMYKYNDKTYFGYTQSFFNMMIKSEL